MNTRHIFVATIDVGEILPFTIKESKDLNGNLENQQIAREQLERFIKILEERFGEHIWYMGMDVIDEKNYERFIFEHGGFFEIMVESPLAMNAHFVHRDRADRFCEALKSTLLEIMGDTPMTQMFLSSIEVHDEAEQEMTYQKWDKIKHIKNG